MASRAPARLFHTLKWSNPSAYSTNAQRANFIEQLVRQDAARPGGADSRGAYTAYCTTEHETLAGDRRNHVTVRYTAENGSHITTHHVVIPKD